MGRAPLDEDAIRLIEEHHPNIRFDWSQILKGEEETPPPAPAAARSARDPESRASIPRVEMAEVPERDAVVDEPVSPAHARLGSEGLARLRARHADVQAAISRRVADEERRQVLKGEAERLNPDSWVTDDEVRSGLEQYESVLSSLRDVIGRRRRRRRRVPDQAASPPGQEGPDEDSGSAN